MTADRDLCAPLVAVASVTDAKPPAQNRRSGSGVTRPGRRSRVMVNGPRRDELYPRVDQEFHEQYPDAPGQLSASNPAHADWRQKWIEIRDYRLNDECNRVYWAENPD